MADATLAAASWYHGLLPREDIKQFLRSDGDFLVRMSEPKEPGKREFVMSVMFDQNGDVIKHFVINRTLTNKFCIEKEAFDSVVDLVKHYLDTKQSITNHYKVSIARPTTRRSWQLDHADIESTKKLGEGAFGEVHKGTLKMKKGGKKVDVALKLAKLDVMTKEQIKDIMREARLMRDFSHPNVVRLYGVAAVQEPLMLVMELASNGALDSYLQKNEVNLEKKMEMCTQSAWGIEYLHERNCLHRDIASRNCLYGDGKVKISDFGLSRIGATYQMNPKCRVPIRWLAPETLRTAMYSQKTDVWSFGIMCWEILNNGQEPYPGMMVAEVHSKVKEGYRMPLEWPGIDSKFVNIIMNRCWAESPNERFSMADVSKGFEAFTKIPRPFFDDGKKSDASRDGSKQGEVKMTGKRKKGK
ncbi:hypothetical protein PFISCL1PPCAC_24638 [Pristionchus fissidentatus]|uniref:Tyrosine-protein kinase n=1 Tax=Pristionchus fissidentatus TaxID=1538716 RepID=A0AAV5WMX3_9BILA|nr:hypothetical protein PFISCL1PPCAC_24638 [Pristionchus fissidentatus]